MKFVNGAYYALLIHEKKTQIYNIMYFKLYIFPIKQTFYSIT